MTQSDEFIIIPSGLFIDKPLEREYLKLGDSFLDTRTSVIYIVEEIISTNSAVIFNTTAHTSHTISRLVVDWMQILKDEL
jgi:hypothetical protein